jgi:sigma-E factor negative regulatory protein RseA
MSKDTREHLSALVDGEISRETSRFLVRRLGADDELRATWTRYHLVRDCLRHQDGVSAGEDLCARVSLALESEQPGKRFRTLPTAWFKPVAGLAIAASVALMAVVAVGPGIPGAPQSASELAGEMEFEQFTSPQSLTSAPYSSAVSYSGQSGTASTGRKMDSYLVRHYQVTGASGGKGFVAFVPIVITGSKSQNETDGSAAVANPEVKKDEESKLR